MRYEIEILKNILKDCGINHRFNSRIKPSKHPKMKVVEYYFKRASVNYMYLSETDSIAVTNIQRNSSFVSLCHTLIMPSINSLNVLVAINDPKHMDDVIDMVDQSLSRILPVDLEYEVLGVM